ncbi:MAG: leucine-rich repeat domain-containing protein [Pseudoflavonifractor sp.]|nr:leucine-rich repeat domain-containing protein [Pseudoflavonifractor sp.]
MRRRTLLAQPTYIGKFTSSSTAADWIYRKGRTDHNTLNGTYVSIADSVDTSTHRFTLPDIIPAVNGSVAYTWHNTKLEELSRYGFPDDATIAQGYFAYCANLQSVDLSPLIGSNITQIRGFVRNCTSLPSIDLSPLPKTKVNNVRDLCIRCESFTEIDLSPLGEMPQLTDVGCVTKGCINIKELDLSFLALLPNVTDACQICMEMTSLQSVDFGSLTYDQAAAWWTKDFSQMFSGCSNLKRIRCTSSFRNWLKQNASAINLPTTLKNSTSSTYWTIVGGVNS